MISHQRLNQLGDHVDHCTIQDCTNKRHRSAKYCAKHRHRVEKYGDPNYTKWPRHGGNKTTEFQIYRAMKQRCYDTNYQAYKDYGGRGIKVCERWIGHNGFSNFRNDMGLRPSIHHSLDRINNDGNYSPKNCRWATKHQQMGNRRNSNKVVGVSRLKTQGNYYWEARLTANNVDILRKAFKTEVEAVEARRLAEIQYFGVTIQPYLNKEQ